MRTTTPPPGAPAWRLQDAKAQFSALVDHALRGVPQHVTRRGKRAVVVLSEQDFQALQHGASGRTKAPVNLVEHLLAIPKEPPDMTATAKSRARALAKSPRLNLQPREVDLS